DNPKARRRGGHTPVEQQPAAMQDRLLTTPILGSEVPGDFSRVNPLALLRARRERPRCRRAAEQRDELASSWVDHGDLPGTRCAAFPQGQDAPEAPGKSLGET